MNHQRALARMAYIRELEAALAQARADLRECAPRCAQLQAVVDELLLHLCPVCGLPMNRAGAVGCVMHARVGAL